MTGVNLQSRIDAIEQVFVAAANDAPSEISTEAQAAASIREGLSTGNSVDYVSSYLKIHCGIDIEQIENSASHTGTSTAEDQADEIARNTRSLSSNEYQLAEISCKSVDAGTSSATDGSSAAGKTPTYEGQFTSKADGSHGFSITIGFYDGGTRLDSDTIYIDTLPTDATTAVETNSFSTVTASDITCKVEDVSFFFG